MSENITADRKLGCEKYSLDSCILVKASVDEISEVIRQYFGLQVRENCKLIDYINADLDSRQEEDRQQEILRSNPKKSLPLISYPFPFWRYLDRQWTILPFFEGDDSIAFAFASLLNTDAICFFESRHASHTEFKVFRKDWLVEHYLFGGDVDINHMAKINYLDCDSYLIFECIEFNKFNTCYTHCFKSSIRQITELEIKSAFLARKEDYDDRGFLAQCLKYYGAYIPLMEETPYHYERQENIDSQQWDSCVERMDIAIGVYNWGYFDRNVPTRVC
jgi:hypothetical protein